MKQLVKAEHEPSRNVLENHTVEAMVALMDDKLSKSEGRIIAKFDEQTGAMSNSIQGISYGVNKALSELSLLKQRDKIDINKSIKYHLRNHNVKSSRMGDAITFVKMCLFPNGKYQEVVAGSTFSYKECSADILHFIRECKIDNPHWFLEVDEEEEEA